MSAILIPSRRGFIAGLASLFAAPAIVSASSLMPIKVMRPSLTRAEFQAILNALWGDAAEVMNQAVADAVMYGQGCANVFDENVMVAMPLPPGDFYASPIRSLLSAQAEPAPGDRQSHGDLR